MFRKIDDSVFNKIVSLDSRDSGIDVIIKYSNKCKIEKDLYKIRKNIEYVNLPFISSVACKVHFKDLYILSRLKNIKYITSNAKVTSLVTKSKDVVYYDNIKNEVRSKSKHTCVVIDTGVYPHVDFLLGRNKIIHFVDLINNNQKMYDDNGHGTFVVGVLCGGGVVDNYKGYDTNVDVIVIKALDDNGETTTSKILESMQWVIDNKSKYNIKIVCMSFGSVLSGTEDPLMYGAEVLWNNGIVVVAAGGNNGPDSSTIMSPGASKKIITVGSIDSRDLTNLSVADFSSRGPVFRNYKPDIVLPGVDIISTAIYKRGEYYTTMSGTSVSTPMVAGVVSLMFNHNENYTPDQIKYMLLSATRTIGEDRNSEGFGVLDLRKLKLI